MRTVIVPRARLVWTLGAFFAAAAGAAQESPRATVSILVSAPHGLTWASGPDIARRVDEVRQNPTPYVPFLMEYVDPTRLSQSDEQQRQAENAAAVLVQAGGDLGRSRLAARLADLEAAAARESARLSNRARALGQPRAPEIVQGMRRVGRLRTAERAIVSAFAAAKDPRLRDRVLEILPRAEHTVQASYLDYLRAATPDDPVVRQRLTQLYEDRQSPLYRSPSVGALIGRQPPR